MRVLHPNAVLVRVGGDFRLGWPTLALFLASVGFKSPTQAKKKA
jgi:hypothetical protein